jgi:hypothetical protein
MLSAESSNSNIINTKSAFDQAKLKWEAKARDIQGATITAESMAIKKLIPGMSIDFRTVPAYQEYKRSGEAYRAALESDPQWKANYDLFSLAKGMSVDPASAPASAKFYHRELQANASPSAST